MFGFITPILFFSPVVEWPLTWTKKTVWLGDWKHKPTHILCSLHSCWFWWHQNGGGREKKGNGAWKRRLFPTMNFTCDKSQVTWLRHPGWRHPTFEIFSLSLGLTPLIVSFLWCEIIRLKLPLTPWNCLFNISPIFHFANYTHSAIRICISSEEEKVITIQLRKSFF